MQLVFSLDSRTLLAGCSDSTLRRVPARMWEVPSGRPMGTPMHMSDRVRVVAFSPDGKLIHKAEPPTP
jgi:hypothetical protein